LIVFITKSEFKITSLLFPVTSIISFSSNNIIFGLTSGNTDNAVDAANDADETPIN
jgi:hypothetical protein